MLTICTAKLVIRWLFSDKNFKGVIAFDCRHAGWLICCVHGLIPYVLCSWMYCIWMIFVCKCTSLNVGRCWNAHALAHAIVYVVGLRTPAMPQGLLLLPRMPPACSLVILQPSGDTVSFLILVAAKTRQRGDVFSLFWNHRGKNTETTDVFGTLEAQNYRTYDVSALGSKNHGVK